MIAIARATCARFNFDLSVFRLAEEKKKKEEGERERERETRNRARRIVRDRDCSFRCCLGKLREQSQKFHGP